MFGQSLYISKPESHRSTEGGRKRRGFIHSFTPLSFYFLVKGPPADAGPWNWNSALVCLTRE